MEVSTPKSIGIHRVVELRRSHDALSTIVVLSRIDRPENTPPLRCSTSFPARPPSPLPSPPPRRCCLAGAGRHRRCCLATPLPAAPPSSTPPKPRRRRHHLRAAAAGAVGPRPARRSRSAADPLRRRIAVVPTTAATGERLRVESRAGLLVRRLHSRATARVTAGPTSRRDARLAGFASP
ncbi:hypothetical protein Scep_029946 [Stephania cephalantha]|uniref:Uncharacterized protein n=1 Tax=Stephania cephalantha TaxID=152367 RepID=A0AAP0HI41_9MAGN